MNSLPHLYQRAHFESRKSAIEYLSTRKQAILQQVTAAGALLLRGMGQDNNQHNQLLLEALSNDIVGYSGGGSADRETITKNLTTVTPGPSFLQIPVHNELSYTNNYPRYLAFFCRKSAQSGGATSLADGHKVYESVDKKIIDKLEKHGVCYKRFMYNTEPKFSASVRKSWQQTFLTNDRQQVEKELEKDSIEYRWTRNGLSIRQHRPAIICHPITDQRVWFNQILNFVLFQPVARVVSKAMFGFRDTGVEFGDGTAISSISRRHIFNAFKKNIVNEPWQDNDVLLIDNIACMHGRQRYSGNRVVTVGMFN